MNLLNHNIY